MALNFLEFYSLYKYMSFNFIPHCSTLFTKMASSSYSFMAFVSCYTFIILLLLLGSTSANNLKTNYYSKSCPNVFQVIKPVVKSAIFGEKRLGASLLRLFFHDCFVNVINPQTYKLNLHVFIIHIHLYLLMLINFY